MNLFLINLAITVHKSEYSWTEGDENPERGT